MKGLSGGTPRLLDTEAPLLACFSRLDMTFACARCHHEFSAEEDPSTCPNCGAEAGLERQKGVPIAMKLFGMLVVGVLVATFSGGLISFVAG